MREMRTQDSVKTICQTKSTAVAWRPLVRPLPGLAHRAAPGARAAPLLSRPASARRIQAGTDSCWSGPARRHARVDAVLETSPSQPRPRSAATRRNNSRIPRRVPKLRSPLLPLGRCRNRSQHGEGRATGPRGAGRQCSGTKLELGQASASPKVGRSRHPHRRRSFGSSRLGRAGAEWSLRIAQGN